MSVTIKDISRHLGISVSTVSKALNGYADVSAQTRALVFEASRDLGYHPNAVARNLRRQRTDKVGIVHPLKGFESEVLMGFFQGLALAAQLRGYHLVLYTAPAGDADALRNLCRSQEVDGMILMGTTLAGVLNDSVDLLRQEKTPFVVLGHPVQEPGVAFVASDNRGGVAQVMHHLLALGHERIAYIARSNDAENNAERLDAYRETLCDAGLELRPEYVVDAPYLPHSGADAMRTLLELPQPPSAVVAFNDHIAIDACRAASARGLDVPRDIAVAGYGDIPSSRLTTPAITTVAMPLREMGEAALETLVRAIERKTTTRRVYPTRLVVRASTLEPGRGPHRTTKDDAR